MGHKMAALSYKLPGSWGRAGDDKGLGSSGGGAAKGPGSCTSCRSLTTARLWWAPTLGGASSFLTGMDRHRSTGLDLGQAGCFGHDSVLA